MMKTYKQFKIFTNPINVDLVSGLLWQLDIDGINETDSGLIVFVGSTKNVLRRILKIFCIKLLTRNILSLSQLKKKHWKTKTGTKNMKKMSGD